MPNRNRSQSPRRARRSAPAIDESTVHKLAGVEDAVKATYDEAGNSGLPGANGGPQDAYRHILITAEMVRQQGENLGLFYAKAHELNNAYGGTQTTADSKMDDHNNALAVDIGKRAKTWDDVVRMTRERIEEAARHGGDGKDGRAFWHNKPQQPGWKPVWPKRPAAPNVKGSEQHRYYNNPNAAPGPGKAEDGGEPVREPAAPSNAGPRSDAPALGDRPGRAAAALEAAEDAEAGATAEAERTLMRHIEGGGETVDEILNKPAQAITRDEIDRVIASDNAMTRGHPDFKRANDLVTGWFDRVYGGLASGQDDIAESRIARTPVVAPAPDGGTVAGGARRIGREVLKDAAGIGVRPAVAKLQDALNSTVNIGRPLFRDGAFGPKTGERLRQAVARQGTGSILDTFRRTFPPERV